MAVAFGPGPGYSAENCGVIALGDSDLDVRAALEEGKGAILVDENDSATLARLDDYAPLVRIKSTPKVEKKAEKVGELQERPAEGTNKVDKGRG